MIQYLQIAHTVESTEGLAQINTIDLSTIIIAIQLTSVPEIE